MQYMKKRYILLFVIVLFAAALWGLVRTLEVNAPEQFQNPTPTAPAVTNNTTPEVPAPAQPQPSDVVIDTPRNGQTITSPVTISGKAKGNWYFEASFPISLTDLNGTVLATGIAKAQSDWMTTEYVPFTATLTFRTPPSTTGPTYGYVVLKKDNPSGDPQFDKSVSIKVQW